MKNLSQFQKTVICIIASLLILFPVVFSQSKTPTFPKKNAVSSKIECTAITQKGTQCKHYLCADSKLYCTQHYKISLKYKL